MKYFAMERFLYRLSVSSRNSNFYLKGGLMLMVWKSFYDNKIKKDKWNAFLKDIFHEPISLERVDFILEKLGVSKFSCQ
jgi:hypothetical protein